MIKQLLLSALALSALYGCGSSSSAPATVADTARTTIRGTLREYPSRLPLPHIKMMLYACQDPEHALDKMKRPNRYMDRSVLLYYGCEKTDSLTTDANGAFNFSFIADASKQYVLGSETDPLQYIPDNYYAITTGIVNNLENVSATPKGYTIYVFINSQPTHKVTYHSFWKHASSPVVPDTVRLKMVNIHFMLEEPDYSFIRDGQRYTKPLKTDEVKRSKDTTYLYFRY